MSSVSSLAIWRCPGPPHALIEIEQSDRDLFEYLSKLKKMQGTVDSSTRHRRLFVLFPGNPGVASFYKEFCSTMHARRFDVLVMGLAGHSLTNLNKRRLFALHDQIELADQFMSFLIHEQTLKQYTEGIYLGGHSIGCFIALPILERHKSIRQFFGLCPVLSHIKDSPRGKQILWSNTPALQWFAAFLVSSIALLPYWLRFRLIAYMCPDLEPSLRKLLARNVRFHALLNVFFLFMTSCRFVRSPDTHLLTSLQDKMSMYYVSNDAWIPLEFVEEIRSLCSDLKSFTFEHGEIPHAWCIRHTEAIVESGILRVLS